MSDVEDMTGGDAPRFLIAEYVLGVLGARQHARAEQMIDADPRLQRERDFWINHFSSMNDEFAEVTPPRSVWARIETRLFGPAAGAGWWNSLALWRGVAASALAVAVITVGFATTRPAPDSAALATQLVAAMQAEGSDVQFVAFYDGSGAVRLTALSGASVADKDYELWAIQGGGAPISMGVIPVDGRSTVELSDQVQAGWGEGSVLAVSLEPKGGSPEAGPTGPIVAMGEVHAI